jgi:hypothetical protein
MPDTTCASEVAVGQKKKSGLKCEFNPLVSPHQRGTIEPCLTTAVHPRTGGEALKLVFEQLPVKSIEFFCFFEVVLGDLEVFFCLVAKAAIFATIEAAFHEGSEGFEPYKANGQHLKFLFDLCAEGIDASEVFAHSRDARSVGSSRCISYGLTIGMEFFGLLDNVVTSLFREGVSAKTLLSYFARFTGRSGFDNEVRKNFKAARLASVIEGSPAAFR